MTSAAPSLYDDHKAAAVLTNESPAPWAQADSTRPIYDANRRVVSFVANAQRIVAAMNLINEIAQCDDDIVPDDLWARARKIVEGKL